MTVKRWCSRYAAGTESASMAEMVEAHGDPDDGTHYVLASDYDALLNDISNTQKERDHALKKLGEQVERTAAVMSDRYLFGRALIEHCVGESMEEPAHGMCLECDGESSSGGYRTVIHAPDCAVGKAIALYGHEENPSPSGHFSADPLPALSGTVLPAASHKGSGPVGLGPVSSGVTETSTTEGVRAALDGEQK